MKSRITILVGSETGNSDECAEELHDALSAGGWRSRVVSMESYALPELSGERLVLVITSTFGNGGPPANAQELLSSLETPPDLRGVRFGVCGLGDRTYPLFAQCGKDFDARLAAAGAARVIPLLLCDADFDEEFPDFQRAVLAWLAGAGEEFLLEAAADEPASPPQVTNTPLCTAHPTTTATLRARRRLSGETSRKETMHYELSLPAPLPFEPGDSFAVHPHNAPAEVERILAALDLPGGATVELRGERLTLRRALLERCDLQRVTSQLGAALVKGEGPARRASAAGEQALREWRASRYVWEALSEHPRTWLSPQELVEALRPLAPRLYSVANSPLVTPRELHFTVETLRWRHEGFPRLGVASTWLCERLQLGQPLQIHRVPGNHFRLPEDPATDIVCVGPGTGVAPFRAFLQHRAARGDSGRTWLFFGHQTRAGDALYADELERHRAAGTLSRLTCAWSRDQPRKVYVQDRMREQAEELWRWLSEGAILYVCGDKLHMAGDVRRCVVEIARSAGGLAAPAAEAWVAELERAGRYRLDVY